jgi:hypothetical protein
VEDLEKELESVCESDENENECLKMFKAAKKNEN